RSPRLSHCPIGGEGGEGEERFPTAQIAHRFRTFKPATLRHPLPKGEGGGEGEQRSSLNQAVQVCTKFAIRRLIALRRTGRTPALANRLRNLSPKTIA